MGQVKAARPPVVMSIQGQTLSSCLLASWLERARPIRQSEALPFTQYNHPDSKQNDISSSRLLELPIFRDIIGKFYLMLSVFRSIGWRVGSGEIRLDGVPVRSSRKYIYCIHVV
ncbi:hypothetical protein ASPVEDRAFT_676833 [Aspergillus versicolor CBS 583.65]|uniref:Uncharacterized protein n=1 Tax=Aspergillus versicolor CBS 583.65 TaxID=1036611 RepID=A0A1L9PLV6_ASPVE|nr:uncharacterized protein ASPVEDRAFT_676833 [Aspergillus versicolor CBS 583.65]OJJ02452.1 hypothetical protein ASPVEDRAFT_676833 [Aspergillus versicolor CBS 583.65]